MLAALGTGGVLLGLAAALGGIVTLAVALRQRKTQMLVLGRSYVLLCLLGIVVNSFPFFELEHMRFYGVLQRIAVAYLAVSLLYLWNRRIAVIATTLVVVLVGYWVLLRWVPVPGAGLPGRDVPFMDMRQNLVSWLDRQLFPHHLYRDLPDHNVRPGRPPE